MKEKEWFRNELQKAQENLSHMVRMSSDRGDMVTQMGDQAIKMIKRYEANESEKKTLEGKMAEIEKEMKAAKLELSTVNDHLEARENEFKKTKEEERKIKEALGLDNNSTVEEALQVIKDGIFKGGRKKRELDQLKNQLDEMMLTRKKINVDINEMRKHQERLQFIIRNDELHIEKLKQEIHSTALLKRVQEISKLTHWYSKLPCDFKNSTSVFWFK